MEYVLENDLIKATFNSKGCEMISVISKEEQRECIWGGNPDIWKRHAPVLFPVVGKYKDNKVECNQKIYEMSQHGFARDMEFEIVSYDNSKLVMKITANEETMKKYPYDFELFCGFELKAKKIMATWKVVNKTSENMYFSIGAHPAFIMGDNLVNSMIKIETKDNKIIYKNLDSDGLVDNKENTVELDNNGMLSVSEQTFNNDALIIENNQSKKVSIYKNEKHVVTVEFDAPVFGLWAPPHKNVPFICIEPWYGRADANDFNGDISKREWGNELASNEEFIASYTMEF